MKTAAVVGVALVAFAGITTVAVKKIARARQAARQAQVQHEIRQEEALLKAQQAALKQKGDQARWHMDVWAEERKAEAERIKAHQEVDETANATTIDLQPYINAKLTDAPSGFRGNNDDNLTELPAGKHIYAGVPFDVAGSIQLTGGWLKYHYKKTYPVQVSDIRIDRSCAKIHLLHGNSYLVYTNFGTVVAKLVLHFENSSVRELNLVAGEQSFDWWFPLFQSGLPKEFLHAAPGTERAWTGSNPHIRKWQPELSLVLYKTTFDNPQPGVKLASLDYVSTETATGPFLVGLTVE